MVLAVGCINISMDFAVNPDGSGSFEAELGVTHQFMQMAMAMEEGDSDLSVEEACHELWSEENTGGSSFQEQLSFSEAGFEEAEEIVVDDTVCRYIARVDWSAERSEAAFALLREDEGPSFRRVGSNGWGFEIPFGDIADDELAVAGFVDFSFVINATLPGKPTENNANRVDIGCATSTFTWDYADFSDPPERLIAETDGSDDCGGFGTGPIVAVVLLGGLVVVVGAALAINRSRRRRVESASQDSITKSDSA